MTQQNSTLARRVKDLETQVNMLTTAIDEDRAAMRQMAAYINQLAQALSTMPVTRDAFLKITQRAQNGH